MLFMTFRRRGQGLALCTPLLALLLQLLLSFYSNPSLGLGLGAVSVHTPLGQPLLAEIPVLEDSVQYAPAEIRASQVRGLRARQLGFDLAADAARFNLQVVRQDGTLLLQIRSKNPIREPFISVLIELEWPAGKLHRDYNLLLDLHSEGYLTPSEATLPVAPLQSAPLESNSPDASVAAIARVSPKIFPLASGKAGSWRVGVGDTLSQIAQKIRPDEQIKLVAVVEALHRLNPQAFGGGDIDQLKSDVLLTLPMPQQFAAMPRWDGKPGYAAQARSQPLFTTIKPTPASVQSEPALMVSAPMVAAQASTSEGNDKDRVDKPADLDDLRVDRSPENIHLEANAATEQVDKVNQENPSIQQRIEHLGQGERLAMLERLLTQQNRQIENLRAMLATRKNVVAERVDGEATAVETHTSENPAIERKSIAGIKKPSNWRWWLLTLFAMAAFLVWVGLRSDVLKNFMRGGKFASVEDPHGSPSSKVKGAATSMAQTKKERTEPVAAVKVMKERPRTVSTSSTKENLQDESLRQTVKNSANDEKPAIEFDAVPRVTGDRELDLELDVEFDAALDDEDTEEQADIFDFMVPEIGEFEGAINEAIIYAAYGCHDHAEKMIEEQLKQYPDNVRLLDTLEEIRNSYKQQQGTDINTPR